MPQLKTLQGKKTWLWQVLLVELNDSQYLYFQYGISKFDKTKLKQTETVEKNVLPSAEDMKQTDTE